MINASPLVLTGSRPLEVADSGHTLIYLGTAPLELHLPKGLPQGFGCDVFQLSTGAISFTIAPEVTVFPPFEPVSEGLTPFGLAGKGATSNKGYSVSIFYLSIDTYVARVVAGATTPAGGGGGEGVPGPAGPPGPQGIQGVPGPAGPKGDIGAVGPTGVSANSGNLARLGTDSLLLVPDTSVLKGVTDGTEAAPGTIGEYKVVANTVGVALGQNAPLTVCSLSLTPGDWEIWGTVDFTPPGNVSPNMICASVSVNPNALPTSVDLMTGVGVLNMFTTAALTSGERQVLMTGQCRSNSAASRTLYLVGQTNFGGASNSVLAKGYICARRAR